VKLLSLAICSLGIWVILNAFVSSAWDDVVFGAITAILALIAIFKS
jgi:multisubunit Na+/H+ antiporter MnhE subunit